VDTTVDSAFGWQMRPLPWPWIVVGVRERAALEAELRAEVADGHPLFGMPVVAIARCQACDEVAFSVETDPVRFVRVHLTWRHAAEPAPWPTTRDLSLPLATSLADHGCALTRPER
jgi:hypothetical protein